MASLKERFIEVLRQYEDGVLDNELKDHFGAEYTGLIGHVNDMLTHNQLELETVTRLGQQEPEIRYRLLLTEESGKLAGLNRQQKLVLQTVETAGAKER